MTQKRFTDKPWTIVAFRDSLVDDSRVFVLSYALASVVNTGALFLIASVTSLRTRERLRQTFSSLYVAGGTIARPLKLALATLIHQRTRSTVLDLALPWFLAILLPLLLFNLAVTATPYSCLAGWAAKVLGQMRK